MRREPMVALGVRTLMISVDQFRRNGRAARYVGKFGDKSKVCRRPEIACAQDRAVASDPLAV